MRELGLFTDEEKGSFCTGFIAGVLGANPKDGPALVGRMLPDARQGPGRPDQGDRLFRPP